MLRLLDSQLLETEGESDEGGEVLAPDGVRVCEDGVWLALFDGEDCRLLSSGDLSFSRGYS